ncbi:discoidin domain-containing protein [Acidobacteriota bacterium]
MKNWIRNLLVLLFFTILTLSMTYPLVFNIGSSLPGEGEPWDPLLNTWILAWNTKTILSADFQGFFDANIFYPQKRILTYSEILLPQSIIALPLHVFNNPILAYNCVLLFVLITSAFGMYQLAYYLTKSNPGGLIAGIIFAFSPFMLDHIGLIQALSAGGIPLTFLFLHKFIEDKTHKNLLLFTFFFIIQSLACIYYAFYLSLMIGLCFLFLFLTRRKLINWKKIMLFVFIVSAVASPFVYQYLMARVEMRLSRTQIFGASLTNFLSVSPLNRIYGDILSSFHRPEGALFPGILAFLLALSGCLFLLKRKTAQKEPFSANPVWIYLIIFILSFLFTFGLKGPYLLLYKFVPGFDGMRVAFRFHIFVIFSIAIFAAFGIKAFFASLSKKKRIISFLIITAFVLTEYFSAPIPVTAIKGKKNIPEVYKWLATQKGEFAVAELPFPVAERISWEVECKRMYYSTYHWKYLVNGYSGYFPTTYNYLRMQWLYYPVKKTIFNLKSIGIKYVIFHSSLLNPDKLKDVLEIDGWLDKHAKFILRLGDAYVYELLYSPGEMERTLLHIENKKLSKTGWRAYSNVSYKKTALAFDGNISTRWEGGPQRKGAFFQLDLGRSSYIRGVSLKLGEKCLEYPRTCQVELSTDKVVWEKVAEEDKIDSIISLLRKEGCSLDIAFPKRKARYIKITNLRTQKKLSWSISEIEVFK